MEKTSYICDKCGKEFSSDKELESYWPLMIQRLYKRSNSNSCISESLKVDLCKECNKLFRKRINDFITELSKEFNAQ